MMGRPMIMPPGARPQTAHTARTADDGFILVAVLWILGALAALASIYAGYVANTALAVAVNDDAIQAEAFRSAAVELAAARLLAAPAESRPTRGAFNLRLGRANIGVEFCSEAARIDLNMASKELLAGLFAALGAHPDDAAQYADRIIGWRTAPSSGSQDKEDSLYRAAGLDYGPRGGPFAHVNELALVLGLPPGMVERAMRYVTVYSGRAEINVLDAAPEVIAALPGMSPERLNAVLGGRASLAAGSASTLLGPAQGDVTTEGSKATRVTVRLDFDNGRRIVSEAVILVGRGDEPFRVLSWQDGIDAQPSGVQAVAQVARGGQR
jgi:general secretion pathway protein K